MTLTYVTLPDPEKLKLLQAHCFDGTWPSLDHEKWCLHCEKTFTGRSARVWRDPDGDLWLECGTPGCNGSPIDWADYPWWDEAHPLTREKRRSEDRAGRRNGEARPEA